MRPKVILLLFLLPTFFKSPLLISDLFIGFPKNYIQNNKSLELFRNKLINFPQVENVSYIGKDKSILFKNLKNTNKCSLISIRLIESNLTKEEIISEVNKKANEYYNNIILEFVNSKQKQNIFIQTEIKTVPVDLKEFKEIENIPLFSFEELGINSEYISEHKKTTDNIKNIDNEEDTNLNNYLLIANSIDSIKETDFRCM